MTDTGAEPSTQAQQPAVLERLAALEVQRRNERDKRREDAVKAANPLEDVQVFLQGFAAKQQAAQQQLADLSAKGPADAGAQEQTQAALDSIAALLVEQEKRVAESSYFLPQYEVRACQAQVEELKASLETARAQLIPKRKFAFKSKVSRVKGSEVKADNTAQTTQPDTVTSNTDAAPRPAATERDLQLVAAGRGLSGLSDQIIVRHVEQASDYVVMNCQRCVVFLSGQLGALRLLQLQDCTVVAGPVTGASFMDDLQSCQLYLASYQIRIHRAHTTDFYLRVRSRPIIEHSNGLRFAPYHPTHARTQALLDNSQLREDNTLYSQVDDFDWVKSVQSPHWCVMSDELRRAPPDWPAADTDDVNHDTCKQ